MDRYRKSRMRHGINASRTPRWIRSVAIGVFILAAIIIPMTLFYGYGQYSDCVNGGGKYVPHSYSAIIFMDNPDYRIEPLNGDAVCIYRRDYR